jgi:hypothetical protein
LIRLADYIPCRLPVPHAQFPADTHGGRSVRAERDEPSSKGMETETEMPRCL